MPIVHEVPAGERDAAARRAWREGDAARSSDRSASEQQIVMGVAMDDADALPGEGVGQALE